MTRSADAVVSLGRYHRVVNSQIPEADVVSEARFVMDASDKRGLGLRLLGGVAVHLHAEPRNDLRLQFLLRVLGIANFHPHDNCMHRRLLPF